MSKIVREMYLIWLDILGFERLAEEVAAYSGLTDRKVREDFIEILKQKVEAASARGEIEGKNYGGRDDWILTTNSLHLAFKVVSGILDHQTGYKNYEKIPLEIAIGVGKYDKWARFADTKLIVEKSTIEFLKSKIIKYYHDLHRHKHADQPPKSTFIVLSKSVYRKLEPLDKKICEKVKPEHEESTFFVAEVEKILGRGKIFEFLEKINRQYSSLYDRIDYLYTPPDEYDDIKTILGTDKIVFITGTPEYGKTYTAVRLLWEYFLQGYNPVWVEGGEEWERYRARQRLEDMEKELEPRKVIYFEDPFGKVKYERRENLEREIGTIISLVRSSRDVYVIITSREEVFKRFEKENLSSTEIKDFEKRINLKKPSYSSEKRAEILIKWAESKGCKWFENDNLRSLVLDQVENETKLPTPLSMKDFALSTVNVTDQSKLMEILEDKSKETARSFAKEIESMSDDKILFLSFPFISDFSVDFVKEQYRKLTKLLKLAEVAEFDEIFKWFRDDKVTVKGGRISFSHPSYYEALDYLLTKNGQLTRINKEIFRKVQFELLRVLYKQAEEAVRSHFKSNRQPE